MSRKELTGEEGVDYVVCAVCGKRFQSITNTHLKLHKITTDEYKKLYPDAEFQCLNKKNKRWDQDYIKENEIPDGKVECLICHKYYNKLGGNHLKSHGLTKDEYLKMFPGAEIISDEAIKNYVTSKVGDKHPLNAPKNREVNREIISRARIQHFVDHPEARKEHSERTRQYYIDHPEAREEASRKSIEQWSDQEARVELGKRVSAGHQGIPYDKWDHFLCDNDDWRDWKNVIYINKPFSHCHRHHITKTVVACIPAELHGHISHNLKTGRCMGEMNMLALQFINGYYSD